MPGKSNTTPKMRRPRLTKIMPETTSLPSWTSYSSTAWLGSESSVPHDHRPQPCFTTLSLYRWDRDLQRATVTSFLCQHGADPFQPDAPREIALRHGFGFGSSRPPVGPRARLEKTRIRRWASGASLLEVGDRCAETRGISTDKGLNQKSEICTSHSSHIKSKPRYIFPIVTNPPVIPYTCKERSAISRQKHELAREKKERRRR